VVATNSDSSRPAWRNPAGARHDTPDHASGSDPHLRGLQTPTRRTCGIIVNVQGDLPTLAPADIARDRPLADAAVDIGTLAAVITRAEERSNPNVVKVVGTPISASRLRALYFTRAPGAIRRRAALSSHRPLRLSPRVRSRVSSPLPPRRSSSAEKLEQLRALEAGMRIDVTIVDSVPLGVDTPQERGTGARNPWARPLT